MKREIIGTVGLVCSAVSMVAGSILWGPWFGPLAIVVAVGTFLGVTLRPRWFVWLMHSDSPGLTGRLRPEDAERARRLLNDENRE